MTPEIQAKRKIIIDLLSEIPPDTIMTNWMMPDGRWSAARLIAALKEDCEDTLLAREWASDFFRVCRDVLKRSIKREMDKDEDNYTA